jgi:alpha-glucosidase
MHHLCLAALLLAAAIPAPAQTLARPGLAGSGLNTDPWWKQAVFYQIAANPNTPTDYKFIAAKLDALHALGVDALLLPMPALPGSPASDPALDDFDELIHQASQRGIRTLVNFPAPSVPADLAPTAHFWLSRGIAGFRLVTPPSASPQDTQSLVQALRKITNSIVGQRIVLSDFNPSVSPAPLASSATHLSSSARSAARSNRPGDSTGAQLQIDSQLSHVALPDAASLRTLLAQSLAAPNLLLDFHPPAMPPSSPDPYAALARAMAAILLTTHPAVLINADPSLELQPALPIDNPLTAAPPAPTLADWYSKLSALHHGNSTVRYGSITILNFDLQNVLVWVIRPPSNSALAPPVVVVCNLSSSPLQLSLTNAIHSLNLRGSFLLTLLRTDRAMGAQDIGSVTLPPFAVYIGELHR